MIGRKHPKIIEEEVTPKGFDDFELRLGDMMRGERATLGKSLLDVQRELRIKASYIAAIENCDPDAFDTPGFIAGYVRSYARYLNMDPDKAFDAFCAESGFAVAHGMSAEASVVKKPSREDRLTQNRTSDIFAKPATPFVPVGDSVWSRVEPGAIGSSLVLVMLIGAIGFGGWSVLQEVQRVQVAPVDETPVVLAELDPLQDAAAAPRAGANPAAPQLTENPRGDALDRLYRPQPLDVPVLTPRDEAIASIDPRSFGSFAAPQPRRNNAVIAGVNDGLSNDVPLSTVNVPQVVEGPAPALEMVAVRTSWVRVRAADGTVIFEKTMQAGDTWVAPATEEAPTLRTGESGAIYFAMDGQFYGPAGAPGSVTRNLSLDVAALKESYQPAELGQDDGLTRYAEAKALQATGATTGDE